MSTRFYKIENLSDILAKFREELNLALQPVNERLNTLEAAVARKKISRVQVSERGLDPVALKNTIIQLRYLNVALRGYGQLITQLGLPKDVKMAYRQLENMVMLALRLNQYLNIILMMEKAVYLSSPWGWLLAGGYLASALAYGSKTIGSF
ncbi:MAG: hypothetical protein ACPLKS_06135 [Caldisericum exile]|uniref:hypothetical protein n=1 Tax=Caldisericum exile TaxID=693075 RepID=UPI003C747991